MNDVGPSVFFLLGCQCLVCFVLQLNHMICQVSMTIISTLIKQPEHALKYSFVFGPYHRPPCTREARGCCWYNNSILYCTVQRYRLYICHPPTVRTHLYLMYRKSEHHSRTECCRSRINKISSCSHCLLLTSQWVIPHRAMVVYKGEHSKLHTCLRRPVTLKLLILSLLMCSPLRIEHICLHIDSACWAECLRKSSCFCKPTEAIFPFDSHTCMLLIQTNLYWFFSAHVTMHLSSPQWKPKRRKYLSLHPLQCLPLMLQINHNLFAWTLARCSGSLSTVCPCVPSAVCVPSKDYGFVSVAYFYAKQIFPMSVCLEEMETEQKNPKQTIKRRQKVGQEDCAQRGRTLCFCILWCCNGAGWQ